MLKLIIICILSTTTLAASAANYGPLIVKGTSDSYQTLKGAFDSAQTSQPSDWPLLSDIATVKPSVKCVISTKDQPDTLSTAWIGRVDIKIPGKPSAGQLFPATEASIKSIIPSATDPSTSSSYVGYSNDEWVDLLEDPKNGIHVATSTDVSGDLQSTTVVPDDHYSVRTFADTFRKSASLLFFHENVSFGPNLLYKGQLLVPAPSGDAYGYCYPANQN